MMGSSEDRYNACRVCLTTLAGWKPETEDLFLQDSRTLAKAPKSLSLNASMVESVAQYVLPHLQTIPSLMNEFVHTIKYANATCRDIEDNARRLQIICKLWKGCQVPLSTLVQQCLLVENDTNGFKKWLTKPNGHSSLKQALQAIEQANCFPDFVSHENFVGREMEIITETIIRQAKSGLEFRTILVYDRPHHTTLSIYEYGYPYNDDKNAMKGQVRATSKFLFQISRNPPHGYKSQKDPKEYVTERTGFAPVGNEHVHMEVEVSTLRKKNCFSLDVVEQLVDEIKPQSVTYVNDRQIRNLKDPKMQVFYPISRPEK
jgi:hypothetical protein